MEFRILTAMPGLNREQVADKIRSFVSDIEIGSRKATVGIGYVEQKMCELCPKDLYFPNGHQDPLALILAQLPQDKIRDLWKEAFKSALNEATKSSPDLAIIVTSLSYYRKETYEFYFPIDPRLLTELQANGKMPTVGSILTLIDDIYDLYYRLSRPKHVFNIQELIERTLQQNEGSETDRYKRAMALVVQCLVRVLEWRENEIQASSTLAAILGCPSNILAVKHPIETGVRLLLGDASPKFGLDDTFPVYLSHPISAPRKENTQTGIWPGFVNEFNHFILEVKKQNKRNVHIVPIMPTAIDEFRFMKDGEKLLPRLAPRWPLPMKENGDIDNLLYSAADNYESYDEYENNLLQSIFDPPLDSEGNRVGFANADERIKGILSGDTEISGMLRTLESLIKLQMANRDHLLVRQCPGFLLYRPTFEESPRFTGGVRAEIRDQHSLRKFESPNRSYGRPMAFIHCESDLKRMFMSGSQFIKNAIDAIKNKAREILAGGEGLEIGDLEEQKVISAMAALGDPKEYVAELHKDLFPHESGSISYVSPPSLQATQDHLISTLIEERVRNLCHSEPSVGWKWRYLAIGADGTQLFERHNLSASENPIILATVLDNLSGLESQRIIAARHVQDHFEKRLST